MNCLCPHCSTLLELDDDMIGIQVECPSCNNVFEVTSEPPQTQLEPQVQPQVQPQQRNEKPCPYCGEMILAQAKKCRFCNEILDPELRATNTVSRPTTQPPLPRQTPPTFSYGQGSPYQGAETNQFSGNQQAAFVTPVSYGTQHSPRVTPCPQSSQYASSRPVQQLSTWDYFSWKKYAVFSGRARRREYWGFAISVYCLHILNRIIIYDIESYLVIEGMMTLLTLIPWLAVTVRRLHDTGRSGAWILLRFIPIIGWLILFIFMCIDSQPGDNEYGPNPKKFD